MDRTSRVLVGYATAGGSTQSIAERIADVLRDAGLTVVCRPVGPDLEPGAFDAVVVGSAVHGMAWLRPAVEFLSRLPAGEAPSLWCFSVGGLPHPERTRFSRWLARSELQKIEQRLPGGRRPRDHRMFAGIDLRPAALGPPLLPGGRRTSSGRPEDGPVTSGTGRPSRRGRPRSRSGWTHPCACRQRSGMTGASRGPEPLPWAGGHGPAPCHVPDRGQGGTKVPAPARTLDRCRRGRPPAVVVPRYGRGWTCPFQAIPRGDLRAHDHPGCRRACARGRSRPRQTGSLGPQHPAVDVRPLPRPGGDPGRPFATAGGARPGGT